MKKIRNIFLTILCLFMPITNLRAAESPMSIAVSNEYEFYEGYKLLKNMPSFSSKLSTSGDYMYCLTYHVEAPNGQTVMRGIELKNPGYVYLAQNGFPAKSITGNASKDYYITQIAYWWFIDYLNGVADNVDGNLPAKLKTNFTSEYGDTDIINGINKLVNGAKEASSITTFLRISTYDKNLNLNEDGSYYVSAPIYILASVNFSTYDVSFISNNVNAKIVDSNGNEKSSFSTDHPFYIKVAVNDMNDTANITVKVSSSITSYHAYQYDASEPTKYQALTYSILGSDIQTVSDTTTLVGVNQTASLIVNKRDFDTEEPLSGAKFELYDNENLSGNPIATWTSTKEAYQVNNLIAGTYYLKETKAPDGYYSRKKATTITLKENETKTIYEDNYKTTVRISKLDIATGEEIPGAHLQILDMSGKVLEEWDSTDKKHLVEGLKIGKYQLKETIAPEGYEKSEEIVEFEILDNGKPTEVSMTNIPKTEVPNTGSTASIFFYLAGSLALIAGSITVYNYVKEKKA